MTKSGFNPYSSLAVALVCVALVLCAHPAVANPAGATVTQGSASLNSQGSRLTVTTSQFASINWQSFNIGVGETTTFLQPSASSIVWNQINDPNPSQILGNLNANGFIVLQNSSGFVVGGQAAITGRGVLMTTSRMQVPDLAGGGPWEINSLPPSISIVNYGQIRAGNAGSVYLIADHVENHGKITAQGGTIGLCAGQDVLLSERPDGRGLSAHVTLPEGSVDNDGKLIANAGDILMQARVVNQGGLVQANSVRNVDGTIELLASDTIHLGSKSVLAARGGAGVSDGGSVTVKSDGSFSDDPGSRIDIRGGTRGGNGGAAELCAPWMSSLNSDINGRAVGRFSAGRLSLDPDNIILASFSSDPNAQYSGTVSASDPPVGGTLTLDVTKFSKSLSSISLSAVNDIELKTVWTLFDPGVAASLTLTAGNNIIFDPGSGIRAITQDPNGQATAGNHWAITLTAGTQGLASRPDAGTQGIYFLGNSFIQAVNGDIKLWAANDVLVNAGNDFVNDGNPVYVTLADGQTVVDALSSGSAGINGVRTTKGGNITVTAQFGDVFTGGNINGFQFGQTAKPYYKVNPNVGGISTEAGGDVSISAGNNVVSFLPGENGQGGHTSAMNDAGTGAFGPGHGDVTIKAGNNVYGHFVLANGTGTIEAGGDIGAPLSFLESQNSYLGFALSLASGSWTVSAPNGNITVEDVRNPNGILGEKSGFGPQNYAGYHYFDYSPNASVSFDAGKSVEFTGFDAPHSVQSGGNPVPFILPPSLTVHTGPNGDFLLDTSIILFPSPNQNLNLSVGRDFLGNSADGTTVVLSMSDKDISTDKLRRWTQDSDFGTGDHAAIPPELNNLNPVMISVGRNLEELNLNLSKSADITVDGDMKNANFRGQNLHRGDTTSIDVHGTISYDPEFVFTGLGAPILSANPQAPNSWDSVFVLAVDPSLVGTLTSLNVLTDPAIKAAGLATYLRNHHYLLFPGGNTTDLGVNPGFIYDRTTLQLGYDGNMKSGVGSALTPAQVAALENGAFTVLVADAQNNPVLDANGHLQVISYGFSAASKISTLYDESLNASKTGASGLSIGGPGRFDVHAGSIDLGNSLGITSYGFGADYASLQSVCGAVGLGGAGINVSVDDNLTMISSSIKSEDGGNVNVSVGGAIDLSQGTFDFRTTACYGIYTSGRSDVNVIASGDINVGSACIATFNGGNVFVESLDGDVNAGNGANRALLVQGIFLIGGVYQRHGIGDLTDISSLKLDPAPYGSGILAELPSLRYQAGGATLPGNITIVTPMGNITSGRGGISQIALNGTIGGGPVVSLAAGTPGVAPTDDEGNVILKEGGIIGGTVNVTATGKIEGLIVSRQDANINAGQSFVGSVLSGGSANFTGGGTVSGTIVGIGGVNSTVSLAGANVMSQSVSVGGSAAVSTLSTSSGATSSSQAAAQQAISDAKQQVAVTDNQGDDEKKKNAKPATRRSRVTVILPPKAS